MAKKKKKMIRALSTALNEERNGASLSGSNHEQLPMRAANNWGFENSRHQQESVSTGVDLQTAEQLQTIDSSEAVIADDVHEENTRLKAEIQKLQDDAGAEIAALDDMMLELTNTQEDLNDVKILLDAKERECVDLLARLKDAEELAQATGNQLQKSSAQATAQAASQATQQSAQETTQQAAAQAAAQVQGAEAAAPSQAVVLVGQQQDNDVEELRKQVQFFKTNSERLAKDLRKLTDENVKLSESLDVKQRELDNEMSQHYILKMQAGLA